MIERLHAINPEIRITEFQAFLSEKNVAEILDTAPDAVVDAIDSVRAKCHLLAACRQREIPVIASVRRNLRNEHSFPK